MSEIRQFLARQLERGPWTLGQILVAPGITLRHIDDETFPELKPFGRPGDARELAKYDDAGIYRPLKTAPNLRRGWELRLATVEELHLALDLFYPAAIGTWLAHERGELPVTPLRDTLARQTGMYRVTQLIRDDQAEALIGKMCDSGCLRRRLWRISETQNGFADPQSRVPKFNPPQSDQNPAILCAEACNLLVAACRPLAKENLPPAA